MASLKDHGIIENKDGFIVKRIPDSTWVVTMKLSRVVKFKIWLSTRLIYVAGWLVNADIEIEAE